MSNIDMTCISSREEDDYALPSYSEYGKIIVEILGKIDVSWHPKWKWEIDRYTYEGSAFWINEGMGIDYFVNDLILDEIPHEGIWVIDNIKGYYYKGDWGFDDDDEEWEWGEIRLATEDEINEL